MNYIFSNFQNFLWLAHMARMTRMARWLADCHYPGAMCALLSASKAILKWYSLKYKILVYLKGFLTWQHLMLTLGIVSGLLQHALLLQKAVTSS